MNGLRLNAIRTPTNASLTSVVRQSHAKAGSKLLRPGQQSSYSCSNAIPSRSPVYLSPAPLRSQFLPKSIRNIGPASSSHSFHSSSRLGKSKEAKATGEAPKESAEEEPAKKASEEKSESSEETGKEKTEEEGGEGKKDEKKEAPPPPPPHGDKSPWQVFTETLQSEFKASKEWNESTKALSDGAQQFTENENVKRARQAYEATTGAVSSTTGKVLKNTAGAVGKGAAWTWDTSVVKGVRTGVNATANVIDTATKPIRETEAFKNVKNVIDDGSSSRYGGWVEKEERRKARELRELAETGGKPRQVLQEDPE